jgi:hypothetical protein
MNKRTIYIVFALTFMLGLFFQYSRMDGFLHLSAVRNLALGSTSKASEPAVRDEAAQDRYLLLYDPANVSSILLKHTVEDMLTAQKKAYDERVIHENGTFDNTYTGVLILTGNLAQLPNLDDLEGYVEDGGTAAFMLRPESEQVTPELQQKLGIQSMNGSGLVNGLQMETSFMVGGRDFSLDEGKEYNTDSLLVELDDSATEHIVSADGTPLLWENPFGDGKFLVYNGNVRDEKSNYGLYAAMVSHCGDEGLYPVLACKLFFIDDFPAPVPEGRFSKIYDEMHTTTAEFFRNTWWPYMLDNGQKFGIKYTGLIIETYGNQVKGPFEELSGRSARDNVVVYGRELLAAGGELGLHGYNHQSLAPAGYNQDNLGYTPWESEEDMVDAMTELHRYVQSLYPDYDFRTYVPPSNILSPEGHEAVKKAFPGLKVYASLWDGLPSERCYYQDFKRNDDGTFELPRVTSGYVPDEGMSWEAISSINYIGVFSHFVHPDELFYEESKDLTWDQMEHGLRDFLADIFGRYPWLRSATASEAMEYMDDYADLNYRVHRSPDHTTVQVWNYRKPVTFILRSDKELDHANGCKVEWIDDGAYLVRVEDTTAEIYWKGEND